MQRKWLQSSDYCRAVNTIKGLLWIGSTVWKSVWQEHTVMKCVCVCVCESCTDSSRSAFQHKASFLLRWKTCKLLAALQSHSAAMFTGIRLLSDEPEPPFNSFWHVRAPGTEREKTLPKMYDMCVTNSRCDCRRLQHHVGVWTPWTSCTNNPLLCQI